MALFKVQITKSVSFKGNTDEFSNVYCYEGGVVDPDWAAVVSALVAAEKTVHASAVTWVRAAVWDIGVPPNTMRYTTSLSGTGSLSVSSGMYRECAYLIKWPLPRSTATTRSVARSLKKWLHVCSNLAGTNTDGTATLTPISGVSALQNYVAVAEEPVAGCELVSPSGAVPNGPAVLHPYLEHHQFPRGRKRTS
jgi:hypothetical protein